LLLAWLKALLVFQGGRRLPSALQDMRLIHHTAGPWLLCIRFRYEPSLPVDVIGLYALLPVPQPCGAITPIQCVPYVLHVHT
jgi:hypothetical protein